MKDALIGLFVGLAAVLAAHWLLPPRAPAPRADVAATPTAPDGVPLADIENPLVSPAAPDPLVAKLAATPIDVFDANGKNFDQLLAELSARVGCNLFVDWRDLEAAGVPRSTHFDGVVRNVRATAALKWLLDGMGGRSIKLGYQAEDGILLVATAETLARDSVTRVYDVRDLIRSQLTRARALRDRPDQRVSEPDPSDHLTKILTQTIDPTSWRDSGGSAGTVIYFGGRLIVVQTRENQAAVSRLLAALRYPRP